MIINKLDEQLNGRVTITWKGYGNNITGKVQDVERGDIDVRVPLMHDVTKFERYLFVGINGKVFRKFDHMFKRAGSNFKSVLNMMTRDYGKYLDDDIEEQRTYDEYMRNKS